MGHALKGRPCLGRQIFDLACFLYASLSHISKGETITRTLLQTDNFLSNKKGNLLYPDAKKFFRNSEKQRLELDIFVNFLSKKHFTL